jgi:hypothetical protein
MSWQTEMTTMLRVVINDIVAPYTYTDERLQQVIVVAAQLMLNDISFPVNYSIDIENIDISPDPTDATRDDAFINLGVLKSGCFMDSSLFRTKAASAGILVKTGPHTVDTKGVIDAYKVLLEKGLCKAYDDAKWEYEAGNLSPGRAILGPFAGINIDTSHGHI